MKEYKKMIFSDYERTFIKKPSLTNILVRVIFNVNQGFTYLFWFRLGSYYKDKSFSFIKYLSAFMHRKYGRKYCIHIPLGTKIGKRFNLGHAMCIVINEKTIIGDNVSIGQFVNIGTNHDTPAIIGDNVYIGPNVCIVEDVKIGDNAIIGAGTVVTHDIPNCATSVGVPNRIINYNQKI